MTNLSQISSKATRNIYKTGTSKTTRREKSIDELKKCLQQQIEELEMSVDGKIKLKDEHIEMTNLNKAKDKATKKKTKKINKNSKQKLSR